MAQPPKWGAAPQDENTSAATPPRRTSPLVRHLTRAFLRFSNDFMAFRPATLEEGDRINDQILRRVIAIGFFLARW